MGKPDFITENGKVKPIQDGCKKRKAAATTVAAAALTGGVVLGSGGIGGSGVGGAGLSDTLSVAMRGKVSKGKVEAKLGNPRKAFDRLGLRTVRRTAQQAASCAINSYGDVQQFFVRSPCRELHRITLPATDDNGNTFLVAVYWVRMPTSASARALRELADADGTGNVTALGGVGPQVGTAEFTGEYYDSKRRGSLVTIAEAAVVDGSPDAELLTAAPQVAVQFPAPRSARR